MTSSFCNLGLRFEGLFWEEVYFEGPKSSLKGTEDFNLERRSPPVFNIEAPYMSLHFEGLSNFSLLVEALVRIQDVDPRA